MTKTTGTDPKNKVKVCFVRWLMSLIGFLESTEITVMEGCLHVRPIQKRTGNFLSHWTTSSMVKDHIRSPGLVGKSPQCREGLRPSSQRAQLSDFTDASNVGWSAHLDQDSVKGL